MDHQCGAVAAQGVGQQRGVADVALDQFAPAHGAAMPAREIVVDHRGKAVALEGLGGVAADEAGAAGDEDALPAHEAILRGAGAASRPSK